MTSPRYQPRQYCEDPDQFGKADTLKWIAPPPGSSNQSRDQQGAAVIQHVMVRQMKQRIKQHPDYRTADGYARAIGADASRIGRIFRGTVIMRLEDIAAAHRHLGVRTTAFALPGQ